jgi:hypothetical protein
MKIIEFSINGWPLVLVNGSPEPRILDIELAKKLGYAHPADIRKLIRRLMDEGILNESEVFATVAKTSMRGGRPAKEYWLTEEQAILVTTQSKTETAITQLKTMVHVFRLAAHGQLPGQTQAQSLGADAVRALLEEHLLAFKAEMAIRDRERAIRDREIDDLKAVMIEIRNGDLATATETEQDAIRSDIRKLSAYGVLCSRPRSFHLTILLDMFKYGARWSGKLHLMPSAKVPYAKGWLEGQLDALERANAEKFKVAKETQRHREADFKARQQKFDFGKKPN